MDRNWKNHRTNTRGATQDDNINLVNQSLPEFTNLDSSLSFDFESNMNNYRHQSSSSSPLPDNGFRQIILPHSGLPQDPSFGGSPPNENSSNPWVFEVVAEDPQRVRAVSFSCERSTVSSDRDDGIFGTSSDSSTYRPRSKSFVENGFSSFSESDQSIGSPKKPVIRSVSWRRASIRTVSRSSEDAECVYCKSIGAEFHGHNNRHCPALAQLDPCNTCGASGADNHTKNHCPFNAKELLQLKPEFDSRISENIRKRNRQRREEQMRLDSYKIHNRNLGSSNNTHF